MYARHAAERTSALAAAPQPRHVPHALTVDDALSALAAERNGLSAAEAAGRLARHGPNRLPAPPGRNQILRFLSHFHNVLIYVLIGAAAITAGLGHLVDTAVILAVVIANATIGFIQEGRAEQAMDAIRKMLAPRTTVLRDGKRRSIDSAEVVPGDIVLLEAGEKVTADLRLIEAAGLRIEEAILTGESVPAEKSTEPVAADATLGDRACMAFSGTLVTGGAGRGVVVATGARTEIGRISGMLSRVETLTTPLIQQMDGFARWLTFLILLIAAVLLVYGYFVGHLPFAELFMTVVGLSVAAIPEGLPAVLTITLAVGVQEMARRNAIVRRLPAIETLGSVSVICTDKTGTLTRNEMMVASLATADHVYSVSGNGYAPDGQYSARRCGCRPGRAPTADRVRAGGRPVQRRGPARRMRMAGGSRAIRWRAPFMRWPARSWHSGPNPWPDGHGRTASPSMRTIATWQSCTTTTRARPGSTSKGAPERDPRHVCEPADGRRRRGGRWMPTTGTDRSTPSPRRAARAGPRRAAGAPEHLVLNTRIWTGTWC